MAKRSRTKKAKGRGVAQGIATGGSFPQKPPAGSSRGWLWGLVLVLAVILAYLPVWNAGYVWDDDLILTSNPCIIGPFGLKEIWTTSAADICPLVLTTLWVEHALWGLAPLPYHLVNVFLHAASAVLLWRVLRSLAIPGAWLGAALWALHPVMAESVAWISEIKNTESGLFFLLSILFFLRWLRARNGQARTGGGAYAWTLLFAALAMAGKSSTVILPLVLCLCAWWVEGRWRWRNLAAMVPVFLMSAAAAVVSIATQMLLLATASDHVAPRTWSQRLIAAGDAVWFYLGKLIWPHPLVAIYPSSRIDAEQWISYLPLWAVLAVLFVFWLKRASWGRPWFFAFAYFLAALLPVLGFVNNTIFRYSLVFDHFQYLAAMGPLALAGAGLARLAERVLPARPLLLSGLGAALLLVLGFLSWWRSAAYESEITLWTDTLAKNPECWMAYNNLGNALTQNGQFEAAMPDFQKSLQINPDNAMAHNNLGNVLSQRGQVDNAMKEYQRALEIDPDYPDAHYNLGNVLAHAGRVDEAMAQYRKTIEINPTFARAYNNLGTSLMQKGQIDEAIAQYRQAVAIDPTYADAQNNLARALRYRAAQP